MKCKVDYYKTERGENPVKDFIDELPPKLQAKNMRELVMLSEFGMELPQPYAKPLRGKDVAGLWELRVKLASDITRIFSSSRWGIVCFCCTDSPRKARKRLGASWIQQSAG